MAIQPAPPTTPPAIDQSPATIAPPVAAAADGVETIAAGRSDTGRQGLSLRCPNCRSPIDVPAEASLASITCGVCGSELDLVNNSQATWAVPTFTKLGRFELVERLGSGSFGTVWKARDLELDRTVAIKTPHQGGMNVEETEKFFREARAAAQLRHPNIVSVHEVGRDDQSVYIVSDFVRGVTLWDWLSGQTLTAREAATLCVKLAAALEHAHEKGVVHRDLKPSNIMIDSDGEPHIMDFGLARRELGEVTVTIDGQVLGTPAYMSPEQAVGESHLADRRSDVYSLGVILFQLLTGELPFRGNPRMIMHQVIHEEAPSPRKFNAHVSKDLETITLKCLEKPPGKRYATAAEVGLELKRHLAGEPILARPIGRLERAVRWTRRHKAVAALSSAVVLALVAGTVVSAYFAIDAKRQFTIALSAMNDLAYSYILENRQEESIALFEKTLAAQRQTLGDAHNDTLTTMSELASLYSGHERLEEAIQLERQSLAARRKHWGADHQSTLDSMHLLSGYYTRLGRFPEAIALRKEVVRALKKKLGNDHPSTLLSINQLAMVYNVADRYAEALPLFEEVLALSESNRGPDDHQTLIAKSDLAHAYSRAGRTADAIKLLQDCYTSNRDKLGVNHRATINSLQDLAHAFYQANRFAEAIPLLEQAFAWHREKKGTESEATRNCAEWVVSAYRSSGRPDEAIAFGIQNMAYFSALASATNADSNQVNSLIDAAISQDVQEIPSPLDRTVIGELRLLAGHPKSARAALQAAIEMGEPASFIHKSLGMIHYALGEREAAAASFRAALAARRREDGSFDLKEADSVEMTAAYFLDLVTQEQYAGRFNEDKPDACFPWFYIGQRKEIEGDVAAAIAAYERSAKLGERKDADHLGALARWRLAKLKEPADSEQPTSASDVPSP